LVARSPTSRPVHDLDSYRSESVGGKVLATHGPRGGRCPGSLSGFAPRPPSRPARGQAVMPDGIRMRSGGPRAGPRLGGFPAATVAILATLSGGAALAAEPAPRSLFATIIVGLVALERHEIAALALTLGVIFFAVVTAIALVRTRARAGEREAAARAE